ncbi:hypothetical protein [Cognatishimia sp. WU-CL00825]|uniref:hypothetical protein n=1 Tax=Cognatishimia sp. WU-CL00825 TaxID=3127658 RepID=UPI0033658915
MLFEFLELVLAGFDNLLGLSTALIPRVAEHGLCERNEWSRGLQGLDHRPDITFNLIARDGLPIAVTSLRLAEIVGVGLAAARAIG